jgi:DHA2 family multidrug resistance protein
MAAPTLSQSVTEAPATHKWLITVAVMLGATMEILDTSIANVALPYMQGSFSVTVDEITWVLTSYVIANGIMIPMTGWISARFGRKRYFMTSVVVFVAASALCGIATSLGEMVVFRLMQGAAGAAMIPSSQAILMETFPPSEQAMAMSMWGLGIIMAPIFGPTLGGWITDRLSWRWNFYINVPIGMFSLIMVFLFVSDPPYLTRRKNIRTDYLGILFLIVWLGLMQIVLDRGQRSDWFAAAWVRYFTFLSAASAILLVIHELRSHEPIVDFRIFRYREFTVSVLMIMVMVLGLYAINLLNPLFLQDLLGYTAWRAGLAVLPRGVGAGIAMVVVGFLSRRGIDTRILMPIGFAIGAWAAWQMAHWDLQVSTETIFWPILLFGLVSMAFPLLSAAALTDLPKERIGYGSSLYNMMRAIGAAIGISLVSNLLARRAQVHQSYLVKDLSPFSAWQFSQRQPQVPGAIHLKVSPLLSHGNKLGLGLAYEIIQKQATLMAYNDVYRLIAFLMICLIPCFILLKRPAAGAPAAH